MTLLSFVLAKSVQFPFYSWLIDAMVAPTPASAFLHGAAMIEMGVYLLGRIIQFINTLPEICFTILAIPIVITCIICVLMYPIQTDAKKLLAYSTVNEVMTMYVRLAYAIINPTIGLKASTSYLISHAYLKGLGFLIVGVFGYVYGTHVMRNIKGLLLSTKLVTIGWISAILRLSGIPPFNLFFGKLYILTSVSKFANAIHLVPIFSMLISSCMFFIVSIKWLEKTVFSNSELTINRINIPSLMKYTIAALIVISLTSYLLSYNMISHITIYGGISV